MKKTRIIAIEGIDGSGKGVQYRLLRDALLARGYTVATRDFPAYDSFLVGKSESSSPVRRGHGRIRWMGKAWRFGLRWIALRAFGITGMGRRIF